MTYLADIALALFFAAIIFGAFLAWRRDKRVYNFGKHGGCGGRWEVRDRDSQGGWLIQCRQCEASDWVSWVTPHD